MADVVDVKALRSDPEFHNFINVTRGFVYLGRMVKPYTEGLLKDLHKKISVKLAGEPPCTQRCSEQNRHNATKWCQTCNKWKVEIENCYNGKRTNCSNVESWLWPHDYRYLLPLFVERELSSIDLEDVSTQVSIWNRCNIFKINQNFCGGINKARNRYYGHNSNLHVSNANKQKCFNIFRAACYDPDIGKYIDGNECKRQLGEIENDDHPWTPLNQMTDQLIEVKKLVKNIQSDLEKKPEFTRFISNHSMIFAVLPVIIVCVCAFLHSYIYGHENIEESFHNLRTVKRERFGNCLQETFSFPFPNDMELQGYVTDHQQLIGRQWLVDELEPVVQEAFDSKGILLMAEMGYGKSMIASHIVCCGEDDAWYTLRKHLIAYHVCKFDVPSTRCPVAFIKRLIGMISATVPEFRSAIAFQKDTPSRFDSQKCEKDIIHCIDQELLFALKEVNSSLIHTKIVLIDALDECFDDSVGKNTILKILRHRLLNFPTWIRFVVTSRTSTDVSEHIRGPVRVVELTFDDPRNHEDIRKFISSQQYSQRSFIPQILGGEYKLPVDKLLSVSGGNFLYLTLVLEHWRLNSDIDALSEIPKRLEHIYQLNFERQFGMENHKFNISRLLLELLSASLKSITQSEIVHVFKVILPNISDDVIRTNFDKLSMFLRETGETGQLSFTHMSLYHWLISPNNTKFHISLNVGHQMFSMYMFDKLDVLNNDPSEIDIVELITHVSYSNSSDIIQRFKDMPLAELFHQTNANYNNHTKHIQQRRDTLVANDNRELDWHRLVKLVWFTDSPLAVDLFLHHFRAVDICNEGGFTAAFVASARGHENALKSLIDHGSDILFRINVSLLFVSTGDLSPNIHICKKDLYCGYGLMDIASQHGHIGVVKMIDKKDSSLKRQRNAFSTLPLHLACEFGHLSIVQYLLEPKLQNDTETCFHYAAGNGHLHILHHLKEIGISHKCISLHESNTTFNQMTGNNAFPFRNGKIDLYHGFFFPDLIWRVTEVSPLHVAVTNEQIEVIKFLVAEYPDSAKCTDRLGFTPLLLCLALGCSSDVFAAITLPNNSNLFDTCKEPLSDSSPLKSFIEKITHGELVCPLEGGVPHVMAKLTYDKRDLLTQVLNSSVDLDWQKMDANGLRPIHHAACTANSILIREYELLGINIIAKSHNGSTMFHLAALCENTQSLLVDTIDKHFERGLYDMYNMSVLHYFVNQSTEITRTTEHANMSFQKFTYFNRIMQTVLRYDMRLWEHTDIFGRNVIHYALANGHHQFLLNIFYPITENSFRVLLNATDEGGKSPLRYALHLMRNNTKFVHGTTFAMFNLTCDCIATSDLFNDCSDKCVIDERAFYLMSPPELAISYLLPLKNAVNAKVLDLNYFKEHMFDLLIKSMYLPIIVLRLLQENTTFSFQDDLNKAIEIRLISPYVVLGVAAHMPEMLVVCGKPLNHSPLHMFVQRHDVEIALVVDRLLQKYTLQEVNQCFDTKGFNVLHRAIESGSKAAVSYLLRKGFNPVVGMFSLSSVYTIPFVYGAIYMRKHNISWSTIENLFEHRRYFNNAGFQVNYIKHNGPISFLQLYDEVLSDLLKTTVIAGQPNDEHICSWNTSTLSIVHYAAAAGMTKSLKLIGRTFGPGILQCQNADGITPLYLAALFKRNSVLLYIKDYGTLTIPSNTADWYVQGMISNKHTVECPHLQILSLKRCSVININEHEWYKTYRLILSCTKKHTFLRSVRKQLKQMINYFIAFRRNIEKYEDYKPFITQMYPELNIVQCRILTRFKYDYCSYSRCAYMKRMRRVIIHLHKTTKMTTLNRVVYAHLLESIIGWYMELFLRLLHIVSQPNSKYLYLNNLKYIAIARTETSDASTNPNTASQDFLSHDEHKSVLMAELVQKVVERHEDLMSLLVQIQLSAAQDSQPNNLMLELEHALVDKHRHLMVLYEQIQLKGQTNVLLSLSKQKKRFEEGLNTIKLRFEQVKPPLKKSFYQRTSVFRKRWYGRRYPLRM